MKTDPRLDAYIAKSAPFARPILAHLRALVQKTVPAAEESIKWSMPFFTLNGKLLCNMAAFKEHCSFGIVGPAARAAIEADGTGSDIGAGAFGRLTALADLPPDAKLSGYLRIAAAAIEAGKSPMVRATPRKPRPEIPPPPEFAAALGKNKAAKAAFAAFPPSHRREYLEWITEARREETRDRRIAQAVEWIAEGKSRNWKYEGC